MVEGLSRCFINVKIYMQQQENINPNHNNSLPRYLRDKQLLWQLIIFLILNYYLIEAVGSSTFESMYRLTQTSLLPMNVVFFILLGLDLIYKFLKVPRGGDIQLHLQKKTKFRLITRTVRYYLLKKYLLLDVLVMLIFYISYMVPFSAARVLRLVIVLRIFQIIDFNQKIYQLIHRMIWLRKLYTIIKICYIMFIFSHYFGCWFYLMDQVLIDQEYYGTPALGNQLYYQMNMLCFTPIQQFGDWGRYLYGLYFLSSLISTIAYGDIIGKNPFEEVYVTVLMVLSTISIGMILQQFMMIVRDDSLGMYEFIKRYNSLKTCMDDSLVSMATQSKVRSYLVYELHQQKYHAHEPVAEKLTSKLQKDLKYEAYSHLISPVLEGIFSQQSIKPNLRQFCNICTEVSFQAQTDIYEELLTSDWKSKCYFLYKIGGPVRQYIRLSEHPTNQFENIDRFLPEGRSFFNFAQFLLNYSQDPQQNDHGKYEEGNENNEKEEVEKDSGGLGASAEIYRFYRRGLKSIKISHFILIKLEDFENFMIGKELGTKKIRSLREKILCEEIDLRIIGMHCHLCQEDSHSHTTERCPQLHLTYSQKIAEANYRITEVIGSRQKWKSHPRSQTKSKKILNMPHRNIFLRNIFAVRHGQFEQSGSGEGDVKIVDIFKKIMGSMIESSQKELRLVDSAYDPASLDSQYAIEHKKLGI